MKIEELKDGDMVMQCIETGAKSTYTPPVRRREFVVVVSTDGIKVKDDEGNLSVPDFTEGRWYLEKVRDWTPDEMRSLVGRTVTDDFGTHLITEYRNADGILEAGSKRIDPGEVGAFFGVKYDLVKID